MFEKQCLSLFHYLYSPVRNDICEETEDSEITKSFDIPLLSVPDMSNKVMKDLWAYVENNRVDGLDALYRLTSIGSTCIEWRKKLSQVFNYRYNHALSSNLDQKML